MARYWGQTQQSAKLDQSIRANLEDIGYGG